MSVGRGRPHKGEEKGDGYKPRRFSFTVDRDAHERFEHIASTTGAEKSALLRRLVEEFNAKHAGQSESTASADVGGESTLTLSITLPAKAERALSEMAQACSMDVLRFAGCVLEAHAAYPAIPPSIMIPQMFGIGQMGTDEAPNPSSNKK